MPNQRTVCRLARSFAAAALLCGLLAAVRPITAQQPYKVVDHWKIGGEGGWDYLIADPPVHRLYITRGPHVDVVDTQTGKLVGSIAGLKGAHGVALDNAGKFGYISDGGGNAVVVFDRATLATVTSIPVGTNPDGIVFDTATQTVWAMNGRSKDASVVDVATRKVVATIPLSGKPEFPAIDGKGTVFVNIEDKSKIARLDAHTFKVTAEWAIGTCEGPSGLVFDAVGSRLFTVCDKKMGVLDANTGKLLANPGIGDGPDAAGWDAKDKLAFASCGEGVLSVINAAAPGYPTLETLPTVRGARTMAYDAGSDRIYMSSAEYGPTPAPTAENAHPRAPMLPGSFTVVVIGR